MACGLPKTLDLTLTVPGADPAAVEAAAHTAKANCPVSKVLNCEITLAVHVE